LSQVGNGRCAAICAGLLSAAHRDGAPISRAAGPAFEAFPPIVYTLRKDLRTAMDSFELNKIIGAILGTLLFVMGVGFLAEAIYHPESHATAIGYNLPGEPEGGEEGGGGEEVAMTPIGVLLASADPVNGEAAARKCQSCHDFSEANANKTGPGLYDVVERLIGGHEGFAYSPAMLAHKDAGDQWTYDNLNHFLLSPKGFVPGTKMTFAGVRDDQERADIIAYMSTLSASPKPFPPAEEAATDVGAPTEEQLVEAPEGETPAQTPSVETPETTDGPTNAPGGDAVSSVEPMTPAEPADPSEPSSAPAP
jgi:cytochrome c